MTVILVEIAAGELIDKITILEIKLERITDEAKLVNIRREYDVLKEIYRSVFIETPELVSLADQLKSINTALWDIEDSIRELERSRDFGSAFVDLARSVYRTNDRRSELKRVISELLNSRLVEEKSYTAY